MQRTSIWYSIFCMETQLSPVFQCYICYYYSHFTYKKGKTQNKARQVHKTTKLESWETVQSFLIDLLSLVLCPVDSSWFGLSKIPTLSPQLREIECFQSSPFCAMVWKLIQYVLILSWALWVGDILWEVIAIYSQCRPGSKIPQEGVTEGKEKILS